MTDQLDEGNSPPANLVALPPPVRGWATALGGSRSFHTAAGRGDGRPDRPDLVDGRTGERSKERDYVAFDRHELGEILRVYSRMVALGEWCDYAIDHLADRAVFSIFRRSSDYPLYRVEKTSRLARRQGAYAVITQTGMILKRGGELPRVLKVFDKASLRLAD